MKYQIGNTYLQLNGLKPEHTSTRLELFKTNTASCDAQYQIIYCDEIDITDNSICIYENTQFAVMEKNNCKLFCHILKNEFYAVLHEHVSGTMNHTLYLKNSALDSALHPYFLPSLLGLERLFIKMKGIVLHSSYISFANNGILFTAPSGGGKSTQADLWHFMKSATIVNGDRNLIYHTNGKWFASGLPFSGSSEHCLNETHPLKAIIVLDKGPVNHLLPLGIRGFQNVFSQVTVNPWDKDFCNTAMDLVIQLCSEVPVYYYSCTKTADAVDVLYQELEEKGIIDGIIE